MRPLARLPLGCGCSWLDRLVFETREAAPTRSEHRWTEERLVRWKKVRSPRSCSLTAPGVHRREKGAGKVACSIERRLPPAPLSMLALAFLRTHRSFPSRPAQTPTVLFSLDVLGPTSTVPNCAKYIREGLHRTSDIRPKLHVFHCANILSRPPFGLFVTSHITSGGWAKTHISSVYCS